MLHFALFWPLTSHLPVKCVKHVKQPKNMWVHFKKQQQKNVAALKLCLVNL